MDCPEGSGHPIGYYRNFPRLDVEAQVGHLLDFLAPFGARHRQWAVPALERGPGAVKRRLLKWTEAGGIAGASGNTVLYRVGHGWSDGIRAALAHADSPSRVGTAGVTPEQLAEAIHDRQALVQARGDGQAWTLVVVDTSRSKLFTQFLGSALKAHHPPSGVMLIGVSAEGATSLGRFTDALHSALRTVYVANLRVGLLELAGQLQRQLTDCEICPLGDLTDAALVPVNPPVASFMSAPLDTSRRLEDVLSSDLSLDRAVGVQAGSGNVQVNYFYRKKPWAGNGDTPVTPVPGKVSSYPGHAFISYVREDSDEVDVLQCALEEAGVVVSRDTASLWPGEDWKGKIRDAITHNALVFIACFSSNTTARRKSYQNEELLLTIEQLRLRKPGDPWLIPVRLDDCDIPDFDLGPSRTLASVHRADLFGPSRYRATERLVAAAQRLLEQFSDLLAPLVVPSGGEINCSIGFRLSELHLYAPLSPSTGFEYYIPPCAWVLKVGDPIDLISRSLPPLEGISFKPERKRWAFKCEFDKFLLYTVLTIKIK
jgi:hypothetical protein